MRGALKRKYLVTLLQDQFPFNNKLDRFKFKIVKTENVKLFVDRESHLLPTTVPPSGC